MAQMPKMPAQPPEQGLVVLQMPFSGLVWAVAFAQRTQRAQRKGTKPAAR